MVGDHSTLTDYNVINKYIFAGYILLSRDNLKAELPMYLSKAEGMSTEVLKLQ